ncbi:Disease resistance protein [Corchorus olitorius]|uniref:Disease resistance protein n=1 Tax=Corchorus olitorius TaxID=93759 RepID=A0A1R3HFP0_9ROSI|nr:Disease resistance protein [Corchorus olitorius]
MDPAILALLIYLLKTLNLLCGCGPVRCVKRIEDDAATIRMKLSRLENILRRYDTREDDYQQQPDDHKIEIELLRLASFKAADALEEYDTQQLARRDVDGLCGTVYRILKSIKNFKSEIKVAAGIIRAESRVLCHLSDAMDRQDNNLIRELPLTNLREDTPPAPVLEESDTVGIEAPLTKLKQWLLEDDDPNLTVISVVGMGGIGKTTLVKKLYDDVISSRKDRFCYHAWITIPQSQTLKMDELMKDIIKQAAGNSRHTNAIPQGPETDLQKVQYLLCSSSFLLIFDDLRSINDWDQIKAILPKDISNGNRIIMTTRHTDVVPPACVKFDVHNHSMEKLSQKDSRSLFCRKAFQDGRYPSPPDADHLEQTIESILKKCDGLPLVIDQIGEILRRRSTDEWETVNKSLRFELRNNRELGFMKKKLCLGYNQLTHELKQCFLYLSMFPEDYTIEYNRLTRLWTAENFVKPIEEKTAEEVADGNLKTLLNESLIQVAETSSDGRVKACRVHDIMHKIFIMKSKDRKFAAVPEDGDAAWPDKVRRLSIRNTLQNAKQIRKNSRLRALLVFGLVDSQATMLTLLIKKHKMLRLLDLQAAPLNKFPRGITGMKHLRYLSLRLTNVEVIPSSISNLKNLETFDLKHANVSKLPASIVQLKKLRVLLVYGYHIESYTHFHYKKGFKPPVNIRKMESLQKLSFLEATQGRDMVTELGKLTQLRRLGVIKLKENDGPALWSSVQKLSQLRALSITSDNNREMIDLPDDNELFPRYLQRLYLTGPLKKLPNWLSRVTSLARLSLKWSRLDDSPLLEHLKQLPELVHLELLQVHNGEELHFGNGGFRKLKVLGLDNFDQLRMIRVDEGALASLEKLIIQRCMMLKEVPTGIQHLTKIKVLELFDMPQELIMRLRADGPDNGKIAHIPQVYSTHWIGTSWQSHSLEGTLHERESINLCWK